VAQPGTSTWAPALLGPWEEPVPYHRMLRTRQWRWWRPLLGLAIVFGSFLLASTLFQLVVLGVGEATGQTDVFSADGFGTDALTNTPLGLLALLGGLALGIPAAMLGLRLAHGLPPWLLSSVRGHRWRYQAQTLGIAVAVFFVALIVLSVATVVVDGLPETSDDAVASGAAGQGLLLVLVILVMVPLQAAGEEFVVRGYLLQAVGSWLPRAVSVAGSVLVTSAIFAILHSSNGDPSLAAYASFFVFGVVAAVLTIRTGGLEAAISMHAANNLVGFLLVLLGSGAASEPLDATGVPWSYVGFTVVWMSVFAVLADLLARGRRLDRLTPAAGSPEWNDR
jgi:membrane protease YdiL (CAAX protease family)